MRRKHRESEVGDLLGRILFKKEGDARVPTRYYKVRRDRIPMAERE